LSTAIEFELFDLIKLLDIVEGI